MLTADEKSPTLARTGHASKYSPLLEEAVRRTQGEAAATEPVH